MVERLQTMDKGLLQNRINKYFNSFEEVDFGGKKFNLMPIKNDIPLVKDISYNSTKDIFTIIFYTRDIVSTKKHDDIEFLEDTSGKLIGIKILNLKNKDRNVVDLKIVSDLDDVIKSAKVRIGKKPSFRDLAQVNIEQRKVAFFKDFIRDQLPDLIEA